MSEIPRPRHATRADAAPGHGPWAVLRFASASVLPARPVPSPGGPCRGHLPVNESHGQGADLREDRPAVVLRRDRGLHRPAEVPQPPAGERGRDRQTVVAVSQACVGLLAVTTRTAQPLARRTASASTGRRRGRAGTTDAADRRPRSPHTGGQPVCRSSADRRSVRTDQYHGKAGNPADDPAGCGAQDPSDARVRPGHVRYRGGAGAGRQLPAEGGGVLLPLASCGACLLPGGGLLLRHGCVHLRRDPAHPADERACLPDSG